MDELKAVEDAKAAKKTAENRKRKEKKKAKAAAIKENSVQVNAQVQSELGDLMANFSLGGDSTQQ